LVLAKDKVTHCSDRLLLDAMLLRYMLWLCFWSVCPSGDLSVCLKSERLPVHMHTMPFDSLCVDTMVSWRRRPWRNSSGITTSGATRYTWVV